MKILVIEERVDEYRECFSEQPEGEQATTIEFHSSVPKSPICDVLFASPALARRALEAGCQPKWIQSTWAGVDGLIPAMANTDIRLTGIKGIFGQLMSEYVFAYMLSDLRDVSHFYSLQSKSKWDDTKLPETLSKKTIVIVGTGSIGQHLATTAKYFGMNTIGVNRRAQSVAGFDQVTSDLLSVVVGADYVVGCLPNTVETQQMFDSKFFQTAQSHCLFFNVGRGSSVDEAALVNALSNDQIRAAVLDVFSQEPLPEAHPFWRTKSLTLTPHISAPSFPKDVAAIFLDNLERYTKGLPLQHQIDTATGY